MSMVPCSISWLAFSVFLRPIVFRFSTRMSRWASYTHIECLGKSFEVHFFSAASRRAPGWSPDQIKSAESAHYLPRCLRLSSGSTASASRITAMRIHVDNVSRYLIHASTLDTSLPLPAGSHNMVVQAWDSSGAIFKRSETIAVH